MSGGPPQPDSPESGFYQPWGDASRDMRAGPVQTNMSGPAAQVEQRVLGASRRIDRWQSRFAPVAFAYAVSKKYADDQGSRLAALLAYYTFLSIFPLAIGGFAVLNLVLSSRPELLQRLLNELVPPSYQQQVVDAYEALPSGGPMLAISLVGLLLSGTGCVFALYFSVNQIFAVPFRFRYGFGPRYARILLLVAIGGVGLLMIAIGGIAAADFLQVPYLPRFGAFAVSWLVAAAIMMLSCLILCRRPLALREVVPGSVLAGFSITFLIAIGGWLVSRYVSGASAVYGVVSTVVGFISLLFLVSNSIVLSLEISVVWAWQLWPRGIDINVLFPADERAYALLTLTDERMPSQRNGIAFDATGHDDPRRADLAFLQRRVPGVPRTPYDPVKRHDAETAQPPDVSPSKVHGDDASGQKEPPTGGAGPVGDHVKET